MTYCETPQSAITTSIARDIITRWQGDYHELCRIAQAQGYQTDYVTYYEQREGEYVEVTDVWGWTDETPDDEQDWRIYVEVAQ